MSTVFKVGEDVHFRVNGQIRLGVITGRRSTNGLHSEELYQYWIQCDGMEYNKWGTDIIKFHTPRHVEELASL